MVAQQRAALKLPALDGPAFLMTGMCRKRSWPERAESGY
jgi:hypothetical protein